MSISFGTSCMGRLHHLQATYIKNIQTALNFDDSTKFVLLNYNSCDGMNEWVNDTLSDFIKSKVVKYLHTTKPQVFSQAITKNITMKAGSHDIVCNLDADNILSEKFLQKMNDTFLDKGPVILSGMRLKGIAGRIACRKEHLYQLKGFDETFEGWGAEDLDFVARFEKYYNTTCIKLGFDYLGRAVDHSKNFNRERPGWQLKVNETKSLNKIKNGELICLVDNWGVLPINK